MMFLIADPQAMMGFVHITERVPDGIDTVILKCQVSDARGVANELRCAKRWGRECFVCAKPDVMGVSMSACRVQSNAWTEGARRARMERESARAAKREARVVKPRPIPLPQHRPRPRAPSTCVRTSTRRP
jgi:hypothetical protein